MPPPNPRRPFYEPIFYFLSLAFGTLNLAACTNSLVKSNHDVGFSTDQAALSGIFLIIDVSSLRSPGYALSVGSGSIAVNSLLLLLNCVNFPNFANKTFFLTPVALLIFDLLTLISACIVTKQGRTGVASLDATLKATGTKIPASIIIAQGKATGGPPVVYWENWYVKFMVTTAWPALFFGLITTFFAIKFYREQTSTHKRLTEEARLATMQPAESTVEVDEKMDTKHFENA